MTASVYVLKDANGIVRYVGKTVHSVVKRFSRHLAAAREGLRTHKATWIRSMLEAGTVPTLSVIWHGDGDGSKEEIEWIAYFKSAGCDLTNATEGGEGIVGFVQSANLRKTHSESARKFWDSQAGRIAKEKLSGDEFKKTASRAQKARFENQEQLLLHREIRRSPEFRSRQSKILVMVNARPEVKKARSLGSIRRYQNPEETEKARKQTADRFSDPEIRRKHSERMKQWHAERRAS